jgi:hypothetical protein
MLGIVGACRSLLCLTPSSIILFNADTGEGSLSPFTNSTKAKSSLKRSKVVLRSGAGTFFVMTGVEAGACLRAFEIALKPDDGEDVESEAAAAIKVSQVAATSSKLKALSSIQVAAVAFYVFFMGLFVCLGLFVCFALSFLTLFMQDPINKALECTPLLIIRTLFLLHRPLFSSRQLN